jgi:hypothetical protein
VQRDFTRVPQIAIFLVASREMEDRSQIVAKGRMIGSRRTCRHLDPGDKSRFVDRSLALAIKPSKITE